MSATAELIEENRKNDWKTRWDQHRGSCGGVDLRSLGDDGFGTDFACAEDGRLLAWRGERGRLTETLPEDGCRYVAAIGERRCVSVGKNGSVTIYSLRSNGFVRVWGLDALQPGEFQAATVSHGQEGITCLVVVKSISSIALCKYENIEDSKSTDGSRTSLEPSLDGDAVVSVALVGETIVLLRASGLLQSLKDGTVKFQRELSRNAKKASNHASEIVQLGGTGPYFAVLFCGCLSFWDSKFGIGFCYIDISSSPFFERISTSHSSLRLETSETERRTYKVIYELPKLSLASAAAVGPGACVEIGDVYDEAPIGSMPQMTAPLTSAADASTLERFEKFVAGSEKDDMEAFGLVVNPTRTPDSDALLSAMKLQGLNGTNARHSIADAPSERLASAAAARCVEEIDHGKLDFLPALASIVRTGSVSLYALTASYSSLSGKASTSAELLRVLYKRETASVLQEVLKHVRDVHEREYVTVTSHALAWMRAGEDDEAEGLIECCVTHSTDPRRLTHALKLLTMRDVNDLIDILDRTVFSNFWSAADDLSTEVLNESYFGESPSRKLGRPIENALVWLSCLIDAHFSSLILEQDSVDRLLSVLKSSREARRLCEVWKYPSSYH
uniref:Uncharacterized protein n=1 Tax=Rhodosorus marinus TaxID=101924 RepID=A0A7S2ZLF0_9RHOD|mmetsp:Transcript_23940/g.94196  ORF Transcript_23940/g.94196 Transcript_23940/m.94196 type:complete len:617 (+) Transcript_23940:152-2002(+)